MIHDRAVRYFGVLYRADLVFQGLRNRGNRKALTSQVCNLISPNSNGEKGPERGGGSVKWRRAMERQPFLDLGERVGASP